jgi:lauroyl/myristoyl acyltransferase
MLRRRAARALRALAPPLGLEATRVAGLAIGLVAGAIDEVAEVFPHLGVRQARRVAANIESQRALAFVLRRVCRRWGNDWLVNAIEVRGSPVLEEQRRAGRPVVVVSWHSGVGAAVTAGLARAGWRGIVLRRGHWETHDVPGFTFASSGASPEKRAQALVRGLETLRRREAVVIFFEIAPPMVHHPSRSFLGRSARFHNGPAALARLAGAALVPVEGRLTGGRLILEIFPAVAAGATDDETTGRLAAFFEARIRRHPGRLWRSSLERLVSRSRPIAR